MSGAIPEEIGDCSIAMPVCGLAPAIGAFLHLLNEKAKGTCKRAFGMTKGRTRPSATTGGPHADYAVMARNVAIGHACCCAK
ncbi:hypothetical protein Bamb_3792 [Burkholderia ambifaria AMMD]|uniref:Uncharacterized protein n=1 Tax=Burkholderia ambifaria (strain ATCC BAA-244 / DSM 16087 / CCUG 44356 / LMG 19182 / AMMD) TaxID=339670 RepID=Q0B927_BURCM|nr:hypothetical protein Bamb_3792 [Burkholderia ambifaria AMMD]